ncbi:MAG TPA: hypothetical protein VG498_22830 [Terriglobales bacterium]|nr:hypothetical protein [Terriglobales bacterium]
MRNAAAAVLLLFCISGFAHQSSDQHQGVVQRGDEVMGFSHEKTIHHFRLSPEGGSIEAIATDASDVTSKQEIRDHLQHIARMFRDGNFNAPMLIHARTPPGVATMKKLRNQIRYQVQDLPTGARISLSSQNPKAVAAIHEFLEFQIRDHQTGDPLTISASTQN